MDVGPATVADAVPVRAVSSLVHIAPSAVQSVGDGPRERVTSSPVGSSVTSKRSERSSTLSISFKSAPDSDSDVSNPDFIPDARSWLNAIRKVNAFVPSWLAGTCWNSAVSASQIVPTAVLLPSTASAPEALLSVKFTVSPPSSATWSGVMVTETRLVVSPAAKVSVPLVDV